MRDEKRRDWDAARLLPASFSRIKDYEQCAFRAYTVHVLKDRGPQGPYMARGEQIHKLAEEFVDGRSDGGRAKPPQAIAAYSAEFTAVLRMARTRPQTELKFGLTAEWEPADFFGRDVWMRGVWDLVSLESRGVRVVDHKTGKVYPETTDQLRLYAAAALAWQPAAPLAIAEAWHLDMDPRKGLHRFEVDRPAARTIMADFTKRVGKMARDRKLAATPNDKCKWCHLRRSIGGPCPEET